MLELKVLLIFCLLPFLHVEALNYNDCGSEYDIEDFRIQDCDQSPCTLKKNTYRNMTLTMYSKHRTLELGQHLKMKLRGLNIKVDVTPDDPCKQINCPVTEQNREHLRVTMDLHNFMLFDAEGTMEWTVMDDNKNQLICVQTLVIIKNT